MATKTRPNIIFTMADDHAAESISRYGAGINSTPSIGRIAEEGMLLNHCYVTNSICIPSRATILCRTYNHVNRVQTLEYKMRVAEDMTCFDLCIVPPDGGQRIGEKMVDTARWHDRKIPIPQDVVRLKLFDKDDDTYFTFQSQKQLSEWKFRDFLDAEGIKESTAVILASDQSFFPGKPGWFDKRFMYEESFQMPFLIRYPVEIPTGPVRDEIIQNVYFAPLDYAGLKAPSYMQGFRFRSLLLGQIPPGWQKVTYHQYWMHRDTPMKRTLIMESRISDIS
ncbi:alkaline phosphatase-like protein [Thozetella sp. PMI_491]|nr:alkaline phosphatase-like protein [Thozetella sp. PMI_491]